MEWTDNDFLTLNKPGSFGGTPVSSDPKGQSKFIEKFFAGDGQPSGCRDAATVILAKGLIDTIGADAFDRSFEIQNFEVLRDDSGKIIKDSGNAISNTKAKSFGDAKPGDWGYFENDPAFKTTQGDWIGENVIKLGDDSAWGWPLGKTTPDAIMRKLADNSTCPKGQKYTPGGWQSNDNLFLNVPYIAEQLLNNQK